jgi:class 3 adenylate cyclase
MSESVTATFLFTDLVGSTELASSMSAEDAEELRRRHFALLRGVVESTGGREVKNLGDGLMVVFSSASRALSCAVEIQQALERHNRRVEVPLEVRIGVATGEATEEGGDFFGDPVVQAARLCARATSGQILATELLRLTVGRHTSLEFTPLGSLELKGLAAPVPVVEVRWEPTGEDRAPGVPLPARLAQYASGGLFGFSGRDPELALLAELAKQASTERRLGVALVAGEPGVGKSCLAAHAAQRACDEGATVLFGECAEGSHAPHLPWMGVLSGLVRLAEPTTLVGLSPIHAWALARLLPADAALLPTQERVEAEAETEQIVLVQAVAAALELIGANAQVLIVLDDLQWADSSSLSLLRQLFAVGGHLGCLIIGTYRPSDLGPGHPLAALLADLRREPAVQRVDLGGLGDREILELIATAAGYEMDEDGVALAHALRRETDGNPFFVAELLRHLAESGAITQDASGRYSLTSDLDELALPQSIRDVIGQRVARLGPEVHRTLATASVIGRTFDLEVLSATAGTDPDRVLDIVETAATASLLEESDRPERYRFAHALIQHALYSELSAARRQRTHLRIAEVLEASGSGAALDAAQLSELAGHWQAATKPTDATKAIAYTRQAAAAAMAALAPADAARLYTQALELLERHTTHNDSRARVEVLLELAGARLAYSHTEGIETLRQAGALAEETGDPELLIACAPDTGTQPEHLAARRSPPARRAARRPRGSWPQ